MMSSILIFNYSKFETYHYICRWTIYITYELSDLTAAIVAFLGNNNVV